MVDIAVVKMDCICFIIQIRFTYISTSIFLKIEWFQRCWFVFCLILCVFHLIRQGIEFYKTNLESLIFDWPKEPLDERAWRKNFCQ